MDWKSQERTTIFCDGNNSVWYYESAPNDKVHGDVFLDIHLVYRVAYFLSPLMVIKGKGRHVYAT